MPEGEEKGRQQLLKGAVVSLTLLALCTCSACALKANNVIPGRYGNTLESHAMPILSDLPLFLRPSRIVVNTA
jgi:hypothetical protein